jgi:hypothetical protein
MSHGNPGGVAANFKTLVSSVTVLQSIQSDLGITLNGGAVSAWADQSPAPFDYSQGTAANQPLFVPGSPGVLGGFPSVIFDGTNDFLSSVLVVPQVSVTPLFAYFVGRQRSYTNNDIWLGDSGGNINLVQQATLAGPNAVRMFNGLAANGNIGAPVGTSGGFVRGEAWFNNAVSDFLHLGSTTTTGTNSGNAPGPSTGRMIGAAGAGVQPGNVEILMLMYFNGKPTDDERRALDAAALNMYGSQVAF